ncbi:MAG TPA: universal stress protein, partial [Polyangia bacterium]
SKAAANPLAEAGQLFASQPSQGLLMLNTVLVGVDGSDNSRRAAQFAHQLVRTNGGKLTVVHVVEPIGDELSSLMGLPAEQLRERRYLYGQRLLEQLCRELELQGAEQVIEIGSASEALCAHAQERDADIIVVGRHGHGPHRLLPGSVGSRLVKITDRTVTVVR